MVPAFLQNIHKQRRAPLFLGAVFFVVHCVFYAMGGRFDDDTFYFWQILDTELLRSRLLESLWYLHMQPPFFNLFLGLVEQWSFGFSHTIYHFLYLLMGILTCIGIYKLQRILQIRRWVAVMVTALCLLSPSWLLYEHWLMYTFPVMAMLTFAPIALHRFLLSHSLREGLVFFGLLAALIYTRALFHPIWYVAIVLFLIPNWKGKKTVLITASSIPFIFVLMLFLKNFMIFGTFSNSTWLGPNLYLMTQGISPSIREELFQQGDIASLYTVKPFSPLNSYSMINEDSPLSQISALNLETKSDGDSNFNHYKYVKINEEYLLSAFALIKQSPGTYLINVWRNWKRFCLPAWNNSFFASQGSPIQNIILFLNRWIMRKNETSFSRTMTRLQDHPPFTFFGILLPVILLLPFINRMKPSHTVHSERKVLLFCLLTCFYVIGICVFCMPFENFRIRFVLTPYIALAVGYLVDRVFITIGPTLQSSLQTKMTKHWLA